MRECVSLEARRDDMIPAETINTIRQRADIVAVVGEAVKLTRRGRNHLGLCPFHKEKTPSFHVNSETGRYYCFGCHEKGSVIDFVMKMEGLGFADAVKSLAQRVGIEVTLTRGSPAAADAQEQARQNKQQLYEIAQIAAVFFETQLQQHPQARVAREEIARRDLAPSSPTDAKADALQAFRVGYAPSQWDGLVQHLHSQGVSPALATTLGLIVPRKSGAGHYDFFRNRLMFAIVDVQGRVVGFSGRILPDPETGQVDTNTGKYINSPESPIYNKGNTVFGLFQARQAMRQKQFALVVEGNFDVVSLHARGIGNAVAPLGTAFTENQARRIRRFVPQISLLFDADEAGKKAVRASREPCAMADLDVRVAVLPTGMDPDDFLRERGVDEMQRVLDNARSMMEYLIDEVMDESYSIDDPAKKAEHIRKVAQIIREERDPMVRQMARQYADKVAARLGLQDPRMLRSVRSQIARAASQAGAPRVRVTGAMKGGGSAASVTDRARQRLAMEMFGCLVEYPELFDNQNVIAAMGHVEGDIVHAFKFARDHQSDDRVAWADALMEGLDPSMHDFVSRHLTAPSYGDAQEACELFLQNARKLKRLSIAREHKQFVKDAHQLQREGDVQQEQDLLMQAVTRHQKRLGL